MYWLKTCPSLNMLNIFYPDSSSECWAIHLSKSEVSWPLKNPDVPLISDCNTVSTLYIIHVWHTHELATGIELLKFSSLGNVQGQKKNWRKMKKLSLKKRERALCLFSESWAVCVRVNGCVCPFIKTINMVLVQ